jgi:hypothetical protein
VLNKRLSRKHVTAQPANRKGGIALSYFVRRTAAAVPLSILAVFMLLALGVAPASAAGTQRGSTTTTVIHVPAMVIDNLCNLDVVNVSGDLTIKVTTTPTRNGGYTVRSTASGWNFTGNRVAPPPPIGYTAADVEQSYTRYAPPPSPAYSFSDVHWTKLVPQGPAPTMYLVIVLRETILADGTAVTTLDRAYLVCAEPCRQSTE